MARSLKFPDDIRPDFEGFTREAFLFLQELKANNERSWFKANKETYDLEVKFAMECLLGEFTRERRSEGFPVIGDPSCGMFRIYRDVRFSRDKSPYKIHAGAVMTRTGAKGEPGIVYVHIEPDGSFISAGFYALDKTFLHAWRLRMAEHPKEFLELVESLGDGSPHFVFGHRGALSSMPRGFRPFTDSPVAPFLKWKHFLVTRRVTDLQAQGRDLVTMIEELGRAAEPLLQYGWDIHALSRETDPRRYMGQRAAS